MRRKDKEITDIKAIEAILNQAYVGHLSLAQNNLPYLVPMCFGYKKNTLYIHSAKEGQKLDIIKDNPNICFEVDMDAELVQKKLACSFDMKYKSVIAFGKADIIEDNKEKKKALNIIMKHYTGKTSFFYPDIMLNKIVIIKIKVDSLTGKKSGYNW